MSKICVVQFYTSNVSYGSFAEEINRKYCEAQGYDYFIEKDDEKLKSMAEGRAFTWIKPKLIGEVIGKYDHVLFMDIDAIFSNQEMRIEEFLDSGYDLIAAEDYSRHSKMNAGVLLFSNSSWTSDFLRKWWESGDNLKGSDIAELGTNNDQPGYFKHGYWHDQSCLSYLYLNGYGDRIKVISNRSFNWREYNQDNFIFHAFARGHRRNRSLDTIHAKIFGTKINPEEMTLAQLAEFYGTDKEYEHRYVTNHYERIFAFYRKKAKRFCEIGIADGVSLMMFRDYFSEATIVGCDLVDKSIEEDRVFVVKMNQSVDAEIDSFCESQDDFDIILDDGSHKMRDQQVTFSKLFRKLNPGGLFIIEDLHTSTEARMPEKSVYNWGDPEKTTTLEMLENFMSSGKIKSDYLTEEESRYLEENIESCEVLKKDSHYFSITSVLKKKSMSVDFDKTKASEKNFEKPKILFLAYTSKKYKGHGIEIDRSDLTRKMSCMETWVPRIEALGHEVIFFDGGNDNQFFDKKNKTLHLISNESYDYHHLKEIGFGSLMLERLKEAISWCLENRDFDYIFRTDDGSYLNAWKLGDFLEELKSEPGAVFSSAGGGGAGIAFSRKTCELLASYENKSKIHIEDVAIFKFFTDLGINGISSSILWPNYVLGEKFFSFHYTNGKRQYFADDVISYYNNGIPIRRKVMINFPFDLMENEFHYLPIKTWDFENSEKTPIWYSFEKDDQNWEYIGNYARSGLCVNQQCPFGIKSINELAFWNVSFDTSLIHEERIFMDYVESVMDKGVLYFNLTEDFTQRLGENTKPFGFADVNIESYIGGVESYMDVLEVDHNSDFNPTFKLSGKVTTIKAKKR